MALNPTIKIDKIYSTTNNDKFIIGCDENGNSIYRKVFTGNLPSTNTQGTAASIEFNSGETINRVYSQGGIVKVTTVNVDVSIPYALSDAFVTTFVFLDNTSEASNRNHIRLYNSNKAWNNMPFIFWIDFK